MKLFERKRPILRKASTFVVLLAFVVNFAISPSTGYAGLLGLPSPGTMVPLSSGFIPTILRGIRIYPDNPLKFDFIVDNGNSGLAGDELKTEGEKIIRYFLASLTLPEKDVWVNLSPYEKDRIVSPALGFTEMGRDLLAQDYLLKQITASLIYPEDELGKAFWEKVYEKAYLEYGTTNVPVNTFNKVWIVPEEATVFEEGDTAYVVESKLKVMLEEDYLAMRENQGSERFGTKSKKEEANNISTEIVREIIIPEIEKEVNEGKNFAPLRQITNSWVLATWFKKNLKKSLLNRVYSDQNKVNGIEVEDKKVSEKIYQQYLSAFKKGVCDYIKIDYDKYAKKHVPRKYFSGGMVFGGSSSSVRAYKQGSEIPRTVKRKIDRFKNNVARIINRAADNMGFKGGIFILTGLMIVPGLSASAKAVSGDNIKSGPKIEFFSEPNKAPPSDRIVYVNERGVTQYSDAPAVNTNAPAGGMSVAPAGEETDKEALAALEGQYGRVTSKFNEVIEKEGRSFYVFNNTDSETGKFLGKTYFRLSKEDGEWFITYAIYSGENNENFFATDGEWRPITTENYFRRTGTEKLKDGIEKARKQVLLVVDDAYNFGVAKDVAPTNLKNRVALAYRSLKQKFWGIGAEEADVFNGRDAYSLNVDPFSGRVSAEAEGLRSEAIGGVYEQPADYEVSYRPEQDQSVTLKVFQIDVSGTIDSLELQQQLKALTFLVENGGEQDLYLIALSGGNNAELESLNYMSKQEALVAMEDIASLYKKGNENTLYIEKTKDAQEKTKEKEKELKALGKEVNLEVYSISDHQQDPANIGDRRLTRDEYVRGATRPGYTLEGGAYKKVLIEGWENLGANVKRFHIQTEGEETPLKDLMEEEGQTFISVNADLSNLVEVVKENQKAKVFSVAVPSTIDKKDIAVYAVDTNGRILENMVLDGNGQRVNEEQIIHDTTGFNDGVAYLDQEGILVFSDSLNAQLNDATYVAITVIPSIRKHDLKKQKGNRIFGVDVSSSMHGKVESALNQVKTISENGSNIYRFSDELKGEGEAGGNTNIPLGSEKVFDIALEKGDSGESTNVTFVSDLNSNLGSLGRYFLSRRPGATMSRIEEFILQGHTITLVTTDATRRGMKIKIRKQDDIPTPGDVLKEKNNVAGRNWRTIFSYLVEMTNGEVVSAENLGDAIEKLVERNLKASEFELSDEYDVESVEVKWTDKDGTKHTQRLTVEKNAGPVKDSQNIQEVKSGEFQKLETKKVEAKELTKTFDKETGNLEIKTEDGVVLTALAGDNAERVKAEERKKKADASKKDMEASRNEESQKYAARSSSASEVKASYNAPGEDRYGGIDLNAEEMELKTKGSGIDFTLPENLETLDPAQIPGFVPTIINIIPVTNISSLWEDSSLEPLARN